MVQPVTSEAVLRATVAAVQRHNGNKAYAARELGIPRQTLVSRYAKALELGLVPEDPQGVEDFTLPELPSEFEPVEDLIARRTAAYALKAKAKAARELIPVKVNIDGPYGILHFGDPHLDDDGTDWPLINHCLGLLHSTPGLFAANVGDTTNNWIGRLARLYGNQGTSAAEAWRMVEWFMGQVRWLYIVGGNHDCWSGGTDPLVWMASQGGMLYQNHGLRLALQSPSGTEVRVNARHDFMGTSQWNGAHGPLKAAKMGYARDHLYTCGHRHSAAEATIFFNDGEHVARALRIGSFKRIDDFADSKGFPRENMPAVLTVHNPASRSPAGLVSVFWDLDEGADYLRFLRRKV